VCEDRVSSEYTITHKSSHRFYPLTNYTILREVEGFDTKPIRNDTKSYSNNNLNILKYCYCHMSSLYTSRPINTVAKELARYSCNNH